MELTPDRAASIHHALLAVNPRRHRQSGAAKARDLPRPGPAVAGLGHNAGLRTALLLLVLAAFARSGPAAAADVPAGVELLGGGDCPSAAQLRDSLEARL